MIRAALRFLSLTMPAADATEAGMSAVKGARP
jgi:hypothetical protein